MSGGLPFPDPVDPGETICVKVTIPNDLLYRGAFWGTLFQLTKWFAWERDSSHSARDVAALWQGLIAQSYQDYLDGERCEDCAMEIRQNPDNPCQLQTSIDGIEWVTVADFSSCAHQTAEDVPLKYTEDSGGYTAEELNVQAMLNILRTILTILCNPTIYGNPETTAINYVRNTMGLSGYIDLDVPLRTIYRAIHDNTSTYTEAQSWLAALDWDGLHDYLVCHNEHEIAEGSGTFLDTLSQLLFNFLSDSSDWMFRALGSASYYLGLGGSQGWLYTTNNGSATQFGWTHTECIWVQDFDFTAGDGGWVIEQVLGDAPQGEYVPGVGFRSTWGVSTVEAPDVGDERINIRRHFATSNILSTSIFYEIDEPFDPSANAVVVIDGVRWTTTPLAASGTASGGDDRTVDVVGAWLAGGLWTLDPPPPPFTASGGKCRIVGAQVTGKGINPFI